MSRLGTSRWTVFPRRVPAPAATLAAAFVIGLAAALFLAAAGPARAGIPDPRFCEADTCLLIAPAGNFAYVVVLRDESYAPVPNAVVALDFTAAIGIVLCTVADPDHDGLVKATTDLLGRAEFHVRGGGQSNGYVVVKSIGQAVGIAYARSTDLNGDLGVTVLDATLHAALPADSRAGDYGCDGDSDAADRQVIQDQIGQDCLTVPVLSSTWGRLKAAYR